MIDHTDAALFKDRDTYGHYWKDEDHLTDWAEAQMHKLYEIALIVGQNPYGDRGLDEQQAKRIIDYARMSGDRFLMPDRRCDGNGGLVEVAITEATLAPWMGLWTDAPAPGPPVRRMYVCAPHG